MTRAGRKKPKRREFYTTRAGALERVQYYRLNGRRAEIIRAPKGPGMKWEVKVIP